MDDPLLSSLCSICHINTPKYTCPRCSINTCSLPCSRRHKIWSECSGVRDPTVFKPMSQLATPSGIDHDYNFLHSIEHKIERSEKRIVEDRGLVGKDELADARKDRNPDQWHVKMQKRKRQDPGQEPIERCLKVMRTTIELAPKGMKRSLENQTSWARNKRAINWQVEWIRERHAGRSLSKVLGVKPIGEAYAEFLEDERKSLLTDEQRLQEKKAREKRNKLARTAAAKSKNTLDLSSASVLQDPETSAWSCSTAPDQSSATGSMQQRAMPSIQDQHFYLHRPKTQSSFPKVLVPLNPAQNLEKLLRRRLVLEFPTIYVLSASPAVLPADKFILEKDYLSATRQPPWQNSDAEEDGSESESSDSDDSESETSSSGSDSDDDADEGELAE